MQSHKRWLRIDCQELLSKIAKTKNANTRRLRYFTLLMDGEIVAVVVTYIHSQELVYECVNEMIMHGGEKVARSCADFEI